MLSVFDIFKIGIGPSSSHTVGPMLAAKDFVQELVQSERISRVARICVELFGSLSATGPQHGTPGAVLLGLGGETPAEVNPQKTPEKLARIRSAQRLTLASGHDIQFTEARDLLLRTGKPLPYHPNGMRFSAFDARDEKLLSVTSYSVGGGFVVRDVDATPRTLPAPENQRTPPPHPYKSAAELLARCEQTGLSISELTLANECCWRSEAEVRAGLLNIWQAMHECIERGCQRDGVLPGGLGVARRAPALYRKLKTRSAQEVQASLADSDWVMLYALAVNEENAAGGRVVTAPTNGAAGIIPAVLNYYRRFIPGADDAGLVRALLSAGAIGALYKENASVSGAEVGCQGEVGSACSMAAGALAEVLGGTPAQVENAAEIGMEHNLGLTCDPVGGLVQVPCIERNAVASVQAITAARMAMNSEGRHLVSLDQVIQTMRDTGRDMKSHYKETARGGLATHVAKIPVNITDC